MARTEFDVCGIGDVDEQRRQKTFVGLEDPFGARRKTDSRHDRVGRTLEWPPSEEWTHRGDGVMCAHRIRNRIDRQDRPDRQRRIRWSNDDDVRRLDGFKDTRCRRCLCGTMEGERLDGISVSPCHKVGLEVDPLTSCDLDVGFDAVIRCGKQRDILEPESLCKIRGDTRKRFSCGQSSGSNGAEREVLVTERERSISTKFRHLVHNMKRVVGSPPTLGSDPITQRVQHGVRIRGDVDTVTLGVVADVDDNAQQARLEDRAKSSCHLGTADPAGKQSNPVIEVVPVRLQNAPHMSLTPTRQASVATIVLADPAGGIEATLEALAAQVYEQVGVVVVGDGDVPETKVSGRRVIRRGSIAEVLESLPASVTHVWMVREGAVPRPDTVSALVKDMDRTGASIAGSKVVRGSDETLVSVGLVTDAFGVTYTGMDSRERDQGQYDVVRDVAAVAGTSMLVRRDLLVGLGGVDPTMSPIPAAVDLCQRARLKGARIIICPASVVDFPKPTSVAGRWKDEASRIRSMMKVYSVLTLLWTLPLDFLIGIVEAIVSIFLGRWLVFDFVKAWIWNLVVLPSTISARLAARRGRVSGDAELFRFQRRGSVRVSRLSKAVASGLRKRLPGDDRLTVDSIGSDLRQPAFVVGVLAVIFVLLSSRNIWSDGLPSVGFTLPFPVDGWDALAGYAGGWNPAGLGSPDQLRPLLAVSGLAKVVTLNAATLAEYVLVAGAMLSGIWGMTRLLRTWSIPAAPALIAGVVYVAGPTAQGIGGNTYIGTVIALGVLPWALRACLAPLADGVWNGVVRSAGAVLVFAVLGALSPLMLLVPVPVLLLYALVRFTNARAWLAVIIALIGTAGGALLLSPWIWQAAMIGIAKNGYAFWNVAPFIAVAGGIAVAAAVVGARKDLGPIAGWGAVLAAAGFFGSRAGDFGFGTEFESVSLAVAGLGLSITVAIVAESVIAADVVPWRRAVLAVGAVGASLLVVGSLTIILGGRSGLPHDELQETLAFTQAREGEAEISRVLLVGPADLMPGDARFVQSGAYRVVSATGPDLGEARLSPRLGFDDLLETKLSAIIAGDTRRAGGELAAFGIRWIVVLGDSDGSDADPSSLAWRNVFAGQLDLLPLSSTTGNAIFVSEEADVSRALTTGFAAWPRIGWDYVGEPQPGRRVFVAENADPGWGPAPRVTVGEMNEVSAETGIVTYTPDRGRRTQALAAAIAALSLIGVVFVGRRFR